MQGRLGSVDALHAVLYICVLQGYVAYRPDYPSKIFDRILSEAKTRGLLKKGSTLVDVATGTGKVRYRIPAIQVLQPWPGLISIGVS